MSLRRILPVLLALAVVAGPTGCGAPSAPGTSVILVTLDTTRADRLGCYGSPDVRTPTLDAWARAGGMVTQAVADVPLTLPSHVTMFTGTPALHHGVRTNADFRLADAAPTLAERMAERGWRAAAVVSSKVLARGTGVAQGFVTFDDELTSPYVMQDSSLFPPTTHWLPKVDRRADEALDRAIAVLGELTGAPEPFLLWLHLYDPHFPYDPPPPWSRVQAERYGGEVAFVDAQLRRLRRVLEERGLAERVAIVVMGDHGEGLDDHGEDEHGILLYDEAVLVPLVVTAPGRVPAGVVLDEQVRTVDLAATVLDLAGIGTTFGAGGSLVGALEGEATIPGFLAYCETIQPRVSYSGSAVKALRSRTEKFVWAPRPELYDLVADPGERHDLAAERPARVAELTKELGDLVRHTIGRRSDWAATPAAAEERLEMLRSLGYIGTAAPGGAVRTSWSWEEEMEVSGFDPKDLVDVAMAGGDVENGFHERARRKLERFVRTADTPQERAEMRPLWSMAQRNLGAVALHAGEFRRAAESLREALRHQPMNEAARWELVMALNLDGRPAEAEREASRLLEEVPGQWRVMLHRGLALALLGRADEARGALTEIAERCPEEESRRLAALVRDAVGTPEEERALAAYRESWRAGR